MSEYQEQILPFEYITGREVTERMKEITKSRDFLSLCSILGIPKGTISTWHQRGLTPFEVIIRLHLATGVPIEYLALGKGEPFPSKEEQTSKESLSIPLFTIQRSELVELRTLSFDKAFIEKIGSDDLILLEHDETSYFVDKNETKANQGKYLIDIDGSFSINELQRLPGKKLAISFNGSTINVEEDDIKVVGRVAMVMGKE
ncbi:putative uncharacterized phage protein [Aliivibrio wodanis]|uniref:Uncharacterized phage protein n=1 Tax=Aliivibrio wodanis TaxID=80852 RepID=A0A090I632_9GAMM|nr:putative uncharacterized phage protein [Aliivibrio wodanis]